MRNRSVLPALIAGLAFAAATGGANAASGPLRDVGGSVSAALHGKPLVVRVHADWCGECQTSLPDFLSFAKTYRGKMNVVDIDVTDGKTSAVAASRAKRLGLSTYYERTKAAPLTVAFINPDSGKVYAALRGNVTLDQLVAAERTVERTLASR